MSIFAEKLPHASFRIHEHFKTKRKIYVYNTGLGYDHFGQLIYCMQIIPECFLLLDVSRGLDYCFKGNLDELNDDMDIKGLIYKQYTENRHDNDNTYRLDTEEELREFHKKVDPDRKLLQKFAWEQITWNIRGWGDE